MTLVALVTLGVITAYKLPVSLLPDIDIPEITIQINYKNTSARELENAVVKPIRNQLLQLNHLKDINSETRDGYSVINLKFDYKTKAQNFFGNLTLWLIFKLFSMNDAYVSAYFYNFDKQVKEVSIEIKVRKK